MGCRGRRGACGRVARGRVARGGAPAVGAGGAAGGQHKAGDDEGEKGQETASFHNIPVVSTWLAICIMLRAGRHPQALTMIGAIGAGMALCGIRGQPVQGHLIINAVGLLISSSVALTLRAADRRLEDAAATRVEALRAQRALIARELHDTLARANTQMVLRAQQAKAQLGDPERADQVAAALDDIVAVGHQSVTDLRTMLRVLREENAVATGTAPLSADLPGALERAEHDLRAAGLRPTLACEGDASILAPFLATTMVRILDEAVANMIKYAARDARCSVQLDVDDEQVGLLVINPLAENRRATPATSSGLGLLGIRESSRSEERRVGKECRSRWSPYH